MTRATADPDDTGMAPSSAGVRFPPPLIYALGFGAGAALQAARALPRLPSPAAPAIGGTAMAMGAGLAGWSVSLFRRAGTHLDPSRPTTALVTSGPYRLTRNPIYLGFALVYTGGAILSGTTWSLVLLPAVLATVDRGVIAREERYLLRLRGDEYREYTRRTRRWL